MGAHTSGPIMFTNIKNPPGTTRWIFRAVNRADSIRGNIWEGGDEISGARSQQWEIGSSREGNTSCSGGSKTAGVDAEQTIGALNDEGGK